MGGYLSSSSSYPHPPPPYDDDDGDGDDDASQVQSLGNGLNLYSSRFCAETLCQRPFLGYERLLNLVKTQIRMIPQRGLMSPVVALTGIKGVGKRTLVRTLMARGMIPPMTRLVEVDTVETLAHLIERKEDLCQGRYRRFRLIISIDGALIADEASQTALLGFLEHVARFNWRQLHSGGNNVYIAIVLRLTDSLNRLSYGDKLRPYLLGSQATLMDLPSRDALLDAALTMLRDDEELMQMTIPDTASSSSSAETVLDLINTLLGEAAEGCTMDMLVSTLTVHLPLLLEAERDMVLQYPNQQQKQPLEDTYKQVFSRFMDTIQRSGIREEASALRANVLPTPFTLLPNGKRLRETHSTMRLLLLRAETEDEGPEKKRPRIEEH